MTISDEDHMVRVGRYVHIWNNIVHLDPLSSNIY